MKDEKLADTLVTISKGKISDWRFLQRECENRQSRPD